MEMATQFQIWPSQLGLWNIPTASLQTDWGGGTCVLWLVGFYGISTFVG